MGPPCENFQVFQKTPLEIHLSNVHTKFQVPPTISLGLAMYQSCCLIDMLKLLSIGSVSVEKYRYRYPKKIYTDSDTDTNPPFLVGIALKNVLN